MNLLSNLFDKNTRRGRAMRTALQVLVSMLSFLGALFALPEFADLVTSEGYVTVGTLAAWTGVIAYLQNLLEDLREGIE